MPPLARAALATDPEPLVAKARELKLAETKQWLRLGHYRPGLPGAWIGGWLSEADGKGFFNAENGKTDPAAELDATIRAFFSKAPVEKDHQHPQCLFAARYKWLRQALDFDIARETTPTADCSGFEDFKRKTRAKSATLVFSSYYLNSPASVFGHTLIRLNKSTETTNGERFELLDYGLNYAANVTTENPVLYALMGMFGGFHGVFTNIPYFYKVREYNDYEARDLWEYDLNLTQDQVDMIVAHAWELGSTYFDYWYLMENCSYHVLGLLEAAVPEHSLATQFHMYAIPADTVRAVERAPGLVKHVRFRPSVRFQFNQRVGKLSDRGRDAFHDIADTQDPARLPADLPDEEKAAVLDTAIDYLDLKHFKDVIHEDSEPAKNKQQLLVARSRVRVQLPPLQYEVPEHDRPTAGHESFRGGLEYGYYGDVGGFIRPSVRFALHDLMDPSIGYPEGSTIEFANLRMRYNTRQQSVWLEELSILQVSTMLPLSRYDKRPSYQIRFGATTLKDKNCDYCLAGSVEGGAGYSVQPWTRTLLFALADLELATSPKLLKSKARVGAGPKGGFRTHITPGLAVGLDANYRFLAFSEYDRLWSFGAELRWELVKGFAFNFKQTRFVRGSESAAGLYWYF